MTVGRSQTLLQGVNESLRQYPRTTDRPLDNSRRARCLRRAQIMANEKPLSQSSRSLWTDTILLVMMIPPRTSGYGPTQVANLVAFSGSSYQSGNLELIRPRRTSLRPSANLITSPMVPSTSSWKVLCLSNGLSGSIDSIWSRRTVGCLGSHAFPTLLVGPNR